MENQNGKEQRMILVVDDIELNRAVLCELFRGRYRIAEAENGQTALALIQQYQTEIAVVLLDIVMPVMNGIAVLQEMKRLNLIDKIPVILITAESNDDTALQGYDMGVADIINKPFHPEIVCRRVENIMELYQHKHNLEALVREQFNILNQQSDRLRRTNAFVVDTLCTVVEFRNGESGAHIKRIRIITKILLEALSNQYKQYRFSSETIDAISSAAAMHDIGKIAIPDFVLLKPGKLTAEEREIMETHTVRGCEILQSLNYTQDEEYYQYCYDICRHHHERWDGKGYPDGLKGDQITIWAQVVSLADVYDALISERVYKPSYSHEKAVKMILNGECGAFNPELLQCFIAVADALDTQVHQYKDQERGAAEESFSVTTLNYPKISPISDRTRRLLELEREKFRTLADLAGDIVFDYDRRTDSIQFSQKYGEAFGGSLQIQNLKQRIQDTQILSECDKKNILLAMEEITPESPNCRLELLLRTIDGSQKWFEVYLHGIFQYDNDLRYTGVLGKINDIHKAKMEALQPGLFNWKAAEELITGYLASGGAGKGGILAFIDVDNFRSINQVYGYRCGDDTLQYIGKSLRKLFQEGGVVGRMGGDEFMVLIAQQDAPLNFMQIGESICDVFRNANKRVAKLSASVGLTRFPQDGVTYRELLHRAELALHHAKGRGKDQFVVFQRNLENAQNS